MGSHISPEIDASIGPPIVALRRLVRALRTSATDIERSIGLSSAQLFVLQTLREAPADSINELAARSMTDQSSVSVVVGRLEAQGLVVRAPAPGDARKTTVKITPLGLQRIDGAPATVHGRLVEALHHLTPSARWELTVLVDELATHLGAPDAPSPFFFENDATGAH